MYDMIFIHNITLIIDLRLFTILQCLKGNHSMIDLK